jgi:hypothetical protein
MDAPAPPAAPAVKACALTPALAVPDTDEPAPPAPAAAETVRKQIPAGTDTELAPVPID